MTNDTWGLNFTSPIDAKQFRECCVSIRTSSTDFILFEVLCGSVGNMFVSNYLRIAASVQSIFFISACSKHGNIKLKRA